MRPMRLVRELLNLRDLVALKLHEDGFAGGLP